MPSQRPCCSSHMCPWMHISTQRNNPSQSALYFSSVTKPFSWQNRGLFPGRAKEQNLHEKQTPSCVPVIHKLSATNRPPLRREGATSASGSLGLRVPGHRGFSALANVLRCGGGRSRRHAERMVLFTSAHCPLLSPTHFGPGTRTTGKHTTEFSSPVQQRLAAAES